MLIPDSGAMSFRVMACAGLPEDWAARAEAARLVMTVDDGEGPACVEALSGWSGPRYAGDGDLAGCAMGGWIFLSYVTAARSVPGGLLAREVALEEMAEMAARHVPFLKRKERAEIKTAVLRRLLPEMPWNFRSVWIAVPEGAGEAGMAFSSALSESDADKLAMAWRATFQTELSPMTDETEALLARVKLADLPATRYAPGPNEVMFCESIGADFLTWAWCRAEMGLPLAGAKKGKRAGAGAGANDHSPIQGLFEEPLTLVLDGNGCKRTVLSKGNVLAAQETKAALHAGKKLAKCKLTLVRDGGDPLAFSVDATLAVRGLKIPKGPNAITQAERLAERMLHTVDCYGALRDAFRAFLAVRASKLWDVERGIVQTWIEMRKVAG